MWMSTRLGSGTQLGKLLACRSPFAGSRRLTSRADYTLALPRLSNLAVQEAGHQTALTSRSASVHAMKLLDLQVTGDDHTW